MALLINNPALNKTAPATAKTSLPTNFKIQSGPTIGAGGLLAGNNLGGSPTISHQALQSTSVLTPEQKLQNENAAKYPGVFQPYTPSLGLKAASQNDTVKPKTTVLATKDQSNNQSPLTTTEEQNKNILGGMGGSQTQTGGATGPTSTTTTETQPTGPYRTAVSGLIGMGGQPGQAYTNQIQTANDINAALAQSRLEEAQALANNVAPANQYGRSIEYQQGAGALLQNLFLNRQNALASQFQGASTLVNAANTQQGLQQSALQGAANLTAPQLGAYGQTYYSPFTAGQAGGGAGVSPSDPFYATLQNYAQMAANGQYAGIPTSITGNAVLNDQLNQMAKQINPNYNPVQSSAQSGIQTQQTQQVAAYQSALQQARNVQSQLTDLISQFGLNPSDINAANAGLQAIARNTSDTRYSKLNNYIQSIANLYSQVLTPVGGSATDTTRGIASSMLDATTKGQGLIDIMNALDQEAQARIAGVPTTGGGSTFSGAAWK